jgi:nucleotide-binding universal stress UspA family protein
VPDRGSTVRPLVAEAGKALDLDRLAGIQDLDRQPTDPVTALIDASREADLLVVGSRGLHGLKSLGSVSERVAHLASCSVLVVRSLATAAALGTEAQEAVIAV